jgi:hypothetical protein
MFCLVKKRYDCSTESLGRGNEMRDCPFFESQPVFHPGMCRHFDNACGNTKAHAVADEVDRLTRVASVSKSYRGLMLGVRRIEKYMKNQGYPHNLIELIIDLAAFWQLKNIKSDHNQKIIEKAKAYGFTECVGEDD